jgi:hypothetical protein
VLSLRPILSRSNRASRQTLSTSSTIRHR